MAHRTLWKQNGRGFHWRAGRTASLEVPSSPEGFDSQVHNTEYDLIEQVVSSPVRVRARAAIALTAAFYALIIGILNIGLAVGFHASAYALSHDRFIVLGLRGESSLHSLLFGLLALWLAYEIFEKKRAALFILVVLLITKSVVGLLMGARLAALPALFMGLIFFSSRKYFTATPEPAALKRFARLMPAFLLVITALGVLGIYGSRASLGVNVHGLAYLSSSARLVTGIGPDFNLHGWPAFFGAILNILMLLGVMYLLSLLLRPWSREAMPDAVQKAKARSLVKKYGSDSLSYFNLRDGKNIFFSEDEDVFLAYKLVAGVAVISSDPVGPASQVPGLLADFETFCSRRGWRIGGIGTSDRYLDSLHNLGLRSWCLGEEAIIHLPSFTLEGRQVRKLRQGVSRIERNGSRMEFMFNASIPTHLRHELVQISADWRGKTPETGFSMGLGRLLRSEDPDCLLAIAYDASSQPIGFLYLSPMYPELGYSLDVTRAIPHAPNGLSEFMLAQTALFLRDRGYRHMSLHFCFFAHQYRDDVEDEGNAFGKAFANLIDKGIPTTSLYRFDRKFQPEWKRRYLLYPGRVDFLPAAFSAISAEAALELVKREGRRQFSRFGANG